MEYINDFFDWARRSGWRAQPAKEPRRMPAAVLCCYGDIPVEYLEFLSRFDLLANATDTEWFLSAADFSSEDSSVAFAWNEFESMSLEAAANNDEWAREIIGFWNKHLPIFYSVGEGYRYWAIEVETGSVVEGVEPEFEQTKRIAGSFPELLAKIIKSEITL